jgi:hypothetical protein
MFGLVLGNGVEISSILRMREPFEVSDMMRKFMSQMSFFVRPTSSSTWGSSSS